MLKGCQDNDLGINLQIQVNIFIFSALGSKFQYEQRCGVLASLAIIQELLERVPLSSNAALPPLRSGERRALEPCDELVCDLKLVVSTKRVQLTSAGFGVSL